MRLNTPFSIVCKTEISPTPSTTQILCSCDFRINIYDCPESSILVISHWVLFPYCALLSATAAACLWHLLKKKNQPFFFTSRRDRGKLRPRPQHTYFTIALIYCPCQMLHSILLLTNSYPNILWAEIGHSLPSTLSATIAVLYPLSIFYSTSAFEVTNFTSRPISTSSAISEIPIARHAVRIDIVCILAFITTLGVFLTVPALTGYYADMSDFINANKFLKIQYIAWFIWVSLYVAAMIWFWSRFLNIIGEMTNQNQTQNPGLQIKLDQLRRGSRNLSLPVYGQILTGFIYLPAFLAYVLYHRSTTMFNYKINLIFLSLWNFLIPIILHITQWIMIYNIYKSITASQNIPKKLSTRNFNNNNNSRAGGEPNTNESTIYQVNEGRNIKKEKRITMTSASEGKMNVDDIELSEFIRTPIDKAIDEEEIYDIEISEVGIPRGEDFMIDSGHCSSGMVLNRDSGRVSISSNSFTKKCKSDSFLNTLHENGIIGMSNRYSGQTIHSETLTLNNNGSTSNIINNIIPITPTNTNSNISSSSTSLPYPIGRMSINSNRTSNEIVSANDNILSSAQRMEWLDQRPVSLNCSNR